MALLMVCATKPVLGAQKTTRRWSLPGWPIEDTRVVSLLSDDCHFGPNMHRKCAGPPGSIWVTLMGCFDRPHVPILSSLDLRASGTQLFSVQIVLPLRHDPIMTPAPAPPLAILGAVHFARYLL
jgi:hypothetical protein